MQFHAFYKFLLNLLCIVSLPLIKLVSGPNMEDLRIYGEYPYPGMVTSFIKLLENYHASNAGSAFALLGYLNLSMHKKELVHSTLSLPTLIISGDRSTGKSTLVQQISSVLPHEFIDNVYRSCFIALFSGFISNVILQGYIFSVEIIFNNNERFGEE